MDRRTFVIRRAAITRPAVRGSVASGAAYIGYGVAVNQAVAYRRLRNRCNGFATRRFRTGFRVSARVHPLLCGAVSEPRRLQRANPAARFAHGVDIGAWFGRLSRRPVDRSVALADGESR